METENAVNKIQLGNKLPLEKHDQLRIFGWNITNIPQNPEVAEVISEESSKSATQSKPMPLLTNSQFCEEYTEEIEVHTKSLEKFYMVKANYMKIQPDVNEKMRAILIDWMVDVNLKFKLKDDSLFLAVNIVDRFLEKEIVKRQKLQLVGVTAMLIASKYEEIYPPEMKDYIYICDNAYTKAEILSMEQHILNVLGYNLNVTSPYRFLNYFYHKFNPGAKVYNMSLYFIELSLLEYKFLKYKPSSCAASALYLSNRLINKDSGWDLKVGNTIGYKEIELKQCAKELVAIMQGVATSTLNAVRRKYSLGKYMAISNVRIGRRS